MTKYLYFMGGMLAGVALIFYEVDMPVEQRCATYMVRTKAVTAYVLKPPPAPVPDPVIIKEKCPVVEPKVEESPPPVEDRPRRHRRHRRYWR